LFSNKINLIVTKIGINICKLNIVYDEIINIPNCGNNKIKTTNKIIISDTTEPKDIKYKILFFNIFEFIFKKSIVN
jgi:hypothetical protein